MEGSLIVYDTAEEALSATKRGGIPRFPVCSKTTLSMLCARHEYLRENSALYHVPVTTSPMVFVNSSCRNSQGAQGKVNLVKKDVLEDYSLKSPSDRTKLLALLGDAKSGLIFGVADTVRAGEELLFEYKFDDACPESRDDKESRGEEEGNVRMSRNAGGRVKREGKVRVRRYKVEMMRRQFHKDIKGNVYTC